MKQLGQVSKLVNLILCLVMAVTLCSCGKKSVAVEPAPAGQTVSEAASGTGEITAPAAGTTETADPEEANTAEDPNAEEPAKEEPEAGTGMTAEELIEKINGPQEIGVFDEVEYVKKKNVESYLVLGIDNGGTYSTSGTYNQGGRSDLMMLLVLDKDAKTFTPVQINRDTIAVIDVLDVFGNPISQTTTQITLAYAYGNGSDSSAQNACRAVSNLFGGIDIDGYAAINYSAVPGINDAVGGVTVTIEDDFTALDPAMAVGETLTLNGQQAIIFCRTRQTVGDGQNTSRMRRQTVYMNAFLKQCKGAAKGHSAVINDVYNAAKPYMLSNMSWNTMSNVGSMILSYSNQGIKSPSGTVSIEKYADGNNYAEFTADSGNIAEIVRDLYYTPAN